MPEQPVFRVLHHLARTGGTLISRCLASMDSVVLLSEIHPRGVKFFNPIAQALSWYPGLLDQRELSELGASHPTFLDVMAYINRRASDAGKALIVRDWTHLDYNAAPFVTAPCYRLTTSEALARGGRVVKTATVRHPIDEWLSLSKLGWVGEVGYTFEQYLEGYCRFAHDAAAIGFVRYEDFTRDPDATLGTLCERLEVAFDPGYRQRWADYTHVTGDSSGRGSTSREISPIQRRPVPADLAAKVSANAEYRAACEVLGYEP